MKVDCGSGWMIIDMDSDIEKLFMVLVRGNVSRCGDEILRELNQNGFYVVKMNGLHTGTCPTCSCQPIETQLHKCQ